jgi:hypothetical protein
MTRSFPKVTVDQLLHRCVAELRLCNDILSRVEDGVIPIISSPISAELRIGLQDMDLLRQSIEDLAQYIAGIADSMGGTQQVDTYDILRAIKLQSLRTRLGGGTAPVRSTESFVEF